MPPDEGEQMAGKTLKQRIGVDLERVDHWIGLGAKTSDRVKRLLKDARQAA